MDILFDLIAPYTGEFVANSFILALRLYPIWLPIGLAMIFWDVWKSYVRAYFFANSKYVLLQIKLPTEITKSPVAMETIIGALYDTSGEGNFFDRNWDGKTRQWYSFELVSIGGDVRFYIWAREGSKDYIESLIYSQYPTVEVHVAKDYTIGAEFDPKVNDIWACDFQLTNKKGEIYPIKTYMDYALHDDPDEEFKIDPLTPVLELLGSIGPEEQVWIQIVFRAHTKERSVPNVWPSFALDPKSWFGFKIDFSKVKLYEKEDWTTNAKAEIKELLEKTKSKDGGAPRQLTETEKRTIEALERTTSKPAFDSGIRAIYYVPNKKAFKKGTTGNIQSAFKAFQGLNGLKPRTKTGFEYKWQDLFGSKLIELKGDFLTAYKKRMWFYPPMKFDTMVFCSEELATLFHFPGSVAATPKLARLPSKKTTAPTNLPV